MPSKIRELTLRAVAAADGTGSATTDVPVRAIVKALNIVFDASSNSGTDVLVENLKFTSDGANQTIYTKDNSNSSVWVYPRRASNKNDGTNFVYAGTDAVPTEFVTHGYLKLSITGQTEAKGVTVYVLVEEY